MKGPEDLRDQGKLEKELYPLLKPVFRTRPYVDTKDIHRVVYTYADCNSRETFVSQHAPELSGKRRTPQILTDLTAKVISHIVSVSCTASS